EGAREPVSRVGRAAAAGVRLRDRAAGSSLGESPRPRDEAPLRGGLIRADHVSPFEAEARADARSIEAPGVDLHETDGLAGGADDAQFAGIGRGYALAMAIPVRAVAERIRADAGVDVTAEAALVVCDRDERLCEL